MSTTQPSLSYAAVPNSSVQHDESHSSVYVLHHEDGSITQEEPEELLCDPSCSCCCACSRRGVGEKGSCCSWLNFLIIFSVLFFCFVAGAVIYSINLIAHLISFCAELKKMAILLPILCGLFWILGIVLLVRSFKFRQRQHQRRMAKQALLQEQIHGVVAVVPSNKCTSRKATRTICSISFWFMFLVLNLAIIIVFSALVYFEIHTLPKNTGTMSMNGMGSLNSQATISRTDHNVLHIHSTDPDSAAHNDYDLFYAQGIAHAQERLWQMTFQRAVGEGRLGEYTGYNDDVMKIDKLSRTMNFYNHSIQAVESLSPRSKVIIQAYCDGVNAYLANSALTLPIEFILLGKSRPRDWIPADVLSWTKIVSYMLSGNLDMELMRWDLTVLLGNDSLSWDRVQQLSPHYDSTKFPIILEGEIPPEDMTGYNHKLNPKKESLMTWLESQPGRDYRAKISAAAAQKVGASSSNATKLGRVFSHPSSPFSVFRKYFGPSTASNNWVVSPSLTKTGSPLMCNDPHLQLMAPSIWILNYLESASFKAVGASFVGTPGIILGHNRNISWSVTNVGADVQDLFIMDGNATHYQWKGQWYQYVIRKEIINVKGGDPITWTVRDVPQYGPVISDLGTELETYDVSMGQPLALRWTSLDSNDTTFDAFLQLNTAQDWNDFQAATSLYRAPSQNMIYADSNGNIGYQTTGLIPIRPNNNTGLAPVPGNGDHDWLPNWVNFTDMPRVYNPKKGYIASANNAVVPDGYKVYLTGDWDAGSDGYRAKRITDLITAQDAKGKQVKHDVTSMIGIQTDYFSGVVSDFQTSILPKLRPQTAAGQAVLASWLTWDGTMVIGSIDAQRFERFYLALQTLGGPVTNSTRWDDAMWIFNTYSGRYADASCTYNSSNTATTSTVPDCLTFAAQQLDRLAADNSETDGQYGIDCHEAQYTHQILGQTMLACVANRYVAHGGDKSTVNVGTVDIDADSTGATDTLTQQHGPSYRQVIDWSDIDSSKFVFGPGQSGNILSGSYDDLVQMWGEGTYLTMDPNELVTNTLTITP